MGQAQTRLTPQTQQLNVPTSAVADVNGNATFQFQTPPTGLVWTGTLTCAGAPATAVFLAAIGATSWGDWAGASVYGPIQAFPNQQLVVTATGLTPGTSYELIWAGSSDGEGGVQPIYPDTNVSAQTVQSGQPSQIFQKLNGVSTTAYTVLVPTAVRTVIILIDPVDQVTLATNIRLRQSLIQAPVAIAGQLVLYNQPPYIVTSSNGSSMTIVPVFALTGSSFFDIAVTGASVGGYDITILGDSALYDESVFYNGVVQTATAVLGAVGSATILNGPARLLTADLAMVGASNGQLFVAGTQASLRANNSYASITWPPNTILPSGKSVTMTAGGATLFGSVTFAYP